MNKSDIQTPYVKKHRGKYGYKIIDKLGNKWIIEPQFDRASDFNRHGIAIVRQNNEFGFIRTDGSHLFEYTFEYASDFEKGFSLVKRNGKYGYVKSDGTILFDPQFDEAEEFHKRIAKVKLNNKIGFIKDSGQYIATPKFDIAYDFGSRKVTLVSINDRWYELKLNGQLKQISQSQLFIHGCDIWQNNECPGWSFLEASIENGKWEFKSWARIMEDNYDEEPYDKVVENKSFATWANSLNLSTSEEVGELLWANAQQLIDDAKIEQEAFSYSAPLRDLTILIQLYWQLKNIEELGLQDVRNGLNLPKEDDLYLNSHKVKRKAIKFCAELLTDDDGFEEFDFTDLIEKSHTPGEYNLISSFESEREDDEDDEDWYDDEEEEDEEDEEE